MRCSPTTGVAAAAAGIKGEAIHRLLKLNTQDHDTSFLHTLQEPSK